MPDNTTPAVGVDPRMLRRLGELLELGDHRTGPEALELVRLIGRIAPGENLVKVQELAAMLARLAAGLLERAGKPLEPI